MITRKLVKWSFNKAAWSQSMVLLIEEFGAQFVADICSVSKSCILNWARGTYTEGYEWPRMQNFIECCDQLELDPREFFYQEDVEQ